MFRSVLTKTLYDRRRGLLAWSAGVFVSTLLICALWPSVEDMDIDALIENYPEELGKLFNISAMTTPAGFLNAEYFSLLGPILFLVFAIGMGARLPAGEEERGTLDVLMSAPVPRWQVLAEQAGALVLAVTLLGVAQLASLLVGSLLFGMDVAVGKMVAVSVAMLLLGVEFGLIALAVGAATGHRALAVAVASVLAVSGYLLYVAAQLVDALEPWGALSPLKHAVGSEPILEGLDGGYAVAMAAVAAVALLAALPLFTRRDLAAA
jgi:ABC-2 type transport system permease protein